MRVPHLQRRMFKPLWIKLNKMKKIKISFLLFLLGTVYYPACEACKLQQPELTQDLTHGTGPQSNWDWAIVLLIAVITVYTFIYSLKYLIRPGERNKKHIKHSILDF